jgi:signal transduction histidine kinase
MALDVLLCDAADEVARLQYHLLRDAPDLVVAAATDVFGAVDTAARARPRVIVCDVGLDGVGGIEFIRRLRASTPSTKVVARAGAPDGRLVAETLAAGASAFVVKEEETEALVAAIRAVVAGGVLLSASAASALSVELTGRQAVAADLERQLAELRDQVSKGTSAKADFLANVSHELRTPLTVAKGIAHVLRNPAVPDAERTEFLGQLQSSLDNLMAIVEEIITVAELERGTFELEVELIDLAPLIRHAVEETERSHPAVPVVSQIPDALLAVADGGRMSGVVHELLDNACRYSPPGRKVELTARNLAEGVVVSVTDRGEGLDRAVATQAFEEPFSTGEATLHKEKAGVGLGLHLARQVVVQHGGVMWADPLPGNGTRVSFCIPSHEGDVLSEPPRDAG